MVILLALVTVTWWNGEYYSRRRFSTAQLFARASTELGCFPSARIRRIIIIVHPAARWYRPAIHYTPPRTRHGRDQPRVRLGPARKKKKTGRFSRANDSLRGSALSGDAV